MTPRAGSGGGPPPPALRGPAPLRLPSGSARAPSTPGCLPRPGPGWVFGTAASAQSAWLFTGVKPPPSDSTAGRRRGGHPRPPRAPESRLQALSPAACAEEGARARPPRAGSCRVRPAACAASRPPSPGACAPVLSPARFALRASVILLVLWVSPSSGTVGGAGNCGRFFLKNGGRGNPSPPSLCNYISKIFKVEKHEDSRIS